MFVLACQVAAVLGSLVTASSISRVRNPFPTKKKQLKKRNPKALPNPKRGPCLLQLPQQGFPFTKCHPLSCLSTHSQSSLAPRHHPRALLAHPSPAPDWPVAQSRAQKRTCALHRRANRVASFMNWGGRKLPVANGAVSASQFDKWDKTLAAN